MTSSLPTAVRTIATAAALLMLALSGQAGAASDAPRQTYRDLFTTDVPGAPTGRAYLIDWLDPRDPEGKPHSFSHLHVELADGARFDTSAVPYCEASDAELMAVGASACPPGSHVANDEIVVDTGFPGPGRYFTTDIAFLNNKNEVIVLATIRGTGARVVLRGRVRQNTIDIDVPILPGTPPDGGAATRQRGWWQKRSSMQMGRQVNYLTTPPTCPDSGFWVNRVTYTYRDGVTQTAKSSSPCDPNPGPDGVSVEIASRSLRWVRRRRALKVRVRSRRPGSVLLRARVRGRRSARGGKKPRRVTLGKARVPLSAGRTHRVKLRLTKRGRKALRGRRRARVAVTGRRGGVRAKTSRTLRR